MTAELLAKLDLDPDVYADYLTGILDAGRDGPLEDALEQVRQVLTNANPAISAADTSAFVDALARLWQARLAQENEQEAESLRKRVVEAHEGLGRLKMPLETKSAAQTSALPAAPRLTEEEKRIILQTSYEPEAEEESTLDGGASANRLRVQQQRQEDQSYRAEQHRNQQAQSKAAEKAGKQAREAKKEQRRKKGG